MKPSALCKGVACLALIHASLAVAGSLMLAAPVKATLTMSHVTGPAGTETVARLQMTLLDDVPSMSIHIESKGCMDELSGAVPQVFRNVGKGESLTSLATFRIRQPAPCDVIAQIITFEDERNRFGSVFGVTVNPAPLQALPGLKKGVTAKGEPTLEAPASR